MSRARVEEALLQREAALHHLQRRAVFRPHGGQGRALLPAPDRLPGRPVLPAHGQRAEAEPRQAAHGIPAASTRRKTGLLPLRRALPTTWTTSSSRGTKARQLVALIEELLRRLRGAAHLGAALGCPQRAAATKSMLRTEGSQERLDNLAELKQSVYEYETTCGEESTLTHYLAHVALFTNGDADDQARHGEADDRPRRQGPGVPLRLPLRHERGHFPLPQGADSPEAWRRSGGSPSWR